MSEHVVAVRVYLTVFAILLALTALTTWVAFIDLGRLNVIIMVAIAVVKATLVILFFMHVRYGTGLTWLVLSTGFAFLLLMIVGTTADMWIRLVATDGPSEVAAPHTAAFSIGSPELPRRPLAPPEH
jgi:cytochrome c oxidase subunit IV